MVRHFFLDKTNSIIEGSMQNVGINPVLHLGYGVTRMRGLLYFDLCPIQELIEDKTFADLNSLTFTLKMANCFAIDGIPYEKDLFTSINDKVVRAASFDLMLFKAPCEWDEGRGFDFISDFWVKNNRSYSQEASNWYFSKNGLLWPYERDLIDLNDPDLNWVDVRENKIGAKGGIYPLWVLKEEYEKYLNGESSIVVGTQHFDFGNENLSINITDYVLECIKTGINYGLCLAFVPDIESIKTNVEQYVGFVTDKTNTFFHPYVEAVYDKYIKDDRESFTVGHENNLCLYVSDCGVSVNLDEVPYCAIDGKNLEVEQITKGVYSAKISAKDNNLTPKAIYYDVWSNIILDGTDEENIELEVATNPRERKLRIGSNAELKHHLVPTVYGINDDEKLGRGEVREVTVDFRRQYETEKKELIDSAYYRLYVKDADREIDVIPYHPIEKAFLNNFFMIYTQDLIPNEYYVDIKVNTGREEKYFTRVLKFTVVSNVTERYN